MGIQIGAKPDSGFDDPLGMLKDCHRRIEHFLHILFVVAERASGRHLTDEEAGAIEAALNYFRVGGQRHTADEEESLFPRLKAAGGLAELDRLEHDHLRATQLHADVETLYRSWIADASLSENQLLQLQQSTTQLRNLYQAHIVIEDNAVFPMAAQMLNRSDIEAIGQEFRKRRM